MTITKYLSISESKKKKRQSRSDYTDNPKLSQALLSINEDNWIKAINVDMKQIAMGTIYLSHIDKPWVLSIYPM